VSANREERSRHEKGVLRGLGQGKWGDEEEWGFIDFFLWKDQKNPKGHYLMMKRSLATPEAECTRDVVRTWKGAGGKEDLALSRDRV